MAFPQQSAFLILYARTSLSVKRLFVLIARPLLFRTCGAAATSAEQDRSAARKSMMHKRIGVGGTVAVFGVMNVVDMRQ